MGIACSEDGTKSITAASQQRVGEPPDPRCQRVALPMSGSAILEDDTWPILSAERIGVAAAVNAASEDYDGAFPKRGIADLAASGLLAAPLPVAMGGAGLGIGDPDRLRAVLVAIGKGSLPLGRLFEGHVNAVALVRRYGDAANLDLIRHEIAEGRIVGVWMAGEPLRLVERDGQAVIEGGKLLCSGTGAIRRPLVAAQLADGGSLMIIPRVPDEAEGDASAWTAHGMRATATGSMDFTGLTVAPAERVGQPGDYLRSPYFRGGAWRVLAVQLGGVEALMEHYRAQLETSPHRDHPVQIARFGEAVIAAETARLWVAKASAVAEGDGRQPEAIDAFVDLARNAFEAAALAVVATTQKAIGLKAFLRPNPLERIARDLATYLRQPALDASLLSAASFYLRGDGRP